jgi:hypothetical protein
LRHHFYVTTKQQKTTPREVDRSFKYLLSVLWNYWIASNGMESDLLLIFGGRIAIGDAVGTL